MNPQGLSLKERARRLVGNARLLLITNNLTPKERIQAKHMKDKENSLINQVKLILSGIWTLKGFFQGSLIGRISYRGGRSSNSSGYSSGSVSSNDRWDLQTSLWRTNLICYIVVARHPMVVITIRENLLDVIKVFLLIQSLVIEE